MKLIIKSFIKYFTKVALIAAFAIGLAASAQINTASPTYSFSVMTNLPAQAGYYNLFTTNTSVKISSIQLLAGGTNVYVNVYDSATTNSTYTNGAYATLLSYTTNTVSTYVSTLTGMTNTQTNFYLWEGTVTNAAGTNTLPFRTYAASANTLATYPVNMLMSKGIGLYSSSAATVIVVYRIND